MTITDAQLESRVLSPRAWQYYVVVIDRELPPLMAGLVAKYNKCLHKHNVKDEDVYAECNIIGDLRHAALVLEDRFRAELERFMPNGAKIVVGCNPGPDYLCLKKA